MADAKRRDWVELLAASLLAIAVVATAWSSYQATRWHGEQAKATSKNNATRTLAVRASSLSQANSAIDIATFIQWVDANAHGDPVLADFYADRFRDEFRPAFDAWIAQDPFSNPDAPLTPFRLPEYEVAAQVEVERLDKMSEQISAEVQQDIQNASNYVLAVVLFAIALFFGGMATKLHNRRTGAALVIIGGLALLGGLVWIATFPISVSV
jgi:hypothetical protein